jgi:hypothetical protein
MIYAHFSRIQAIFTMARKSCAVYIICIIGLGLVSTPLCVPMGAAGAVGQDHRAGWSWGAWEDGGPGLCVDRSPREFAEPTGRRAADGGASRLGARGALLGGRSRHSPSGAQWPATVPNGHGRRRLGDGIVLPCAPRVKRKVPGLGDRPGFVPPDRGIVSSTGYSADWRWVAKYRLRASRLMPR